MTAATPETVNGYEISIVPHPTLRDVFRLSIDGTWIADSPSRERLNELAQLFTKGPKS